jgi:hypothetical protein
MQCSSTAVWGKGSLLHRGQLRRALAPERALPSSNDASSQRQPAAAAEGPDDRASRPRHAREPKTRERPFIVYIKIQNFARPGRRPSGVCHP